ncbi:MAG: peptide chain release factor N(5)-glutamine methyltransferase [Gammaproteobacteria bacterium]
MQVNEESFNSFLKEIKEKSFFSLENQEIKEICKEALSIDYKDLLIGSPTINKKQKEIFTDLVKRRARGEPLAYLLKKKGFWDLDLFINREVLVPRPETETIVEDILKSFDQDRLSIIDLGTGSGALALALKKNRPEWEVFASDIFKESIDVAKKNSETYNLDISLFLGNWMDSVNSNTLDLVVSNPPYIKENDPSLISDGLLFEPRRALIAKNEGLSDLYLIIDGASSKLKKGGSIYLEHAPFQYLEVSKKLGLKNFSSIECIKDLNGDKRVTKAIKKDGR